MATRSFIADSMNTAGVGPIAPAPTSVSRVLRYQLNVIASSAEDVVRAAGGWLCDRARAGWDVNVLLVDGGDARPLTILGASALGPDEDFVAMVGSTAGFGALAVGVDVLRADLRVRDQILRVLKRGLTEVTVWGDQSPAELGHQADALTLRVSSAARAFKSHALAAADVSASAVTTTETLFRMGTGSIRPLYSV
ncbi:MAG: hypothetical protein NVS4B6_05020 [Mycobacterium sp.]